MAYIPSPPQVAKMVRQAMKDRAPAMFNQLRAEGKLTQVVDECVRQFEEIVDAQMNEATSLHLDQKRAEMVGHEATVAALNQAQASAVEQALATILEFPADSSGD